MKVKYFPDTDTALIEFTDKEVYKIKEISEDIYIDLDQNGNLVNMTIEHAKAKAGLCEFSYQEMVIPLEKSPNKSLKLTAIPLACLLQGALHSGRWLSR